MPVKLVPWAWLICVMSNCSTWANCENFSKHTTCR